MNSIGNQMGPPGKGKENVKLLSPLPLFLERGSLTSSPGSFLRIIILLTTCTPQLQGPHQQQPMKGRFFFLKRKYLTLSPLWEHFPLPRQFLGIILHRLNSSTVDLQSYFEFLKCRDWAPQSNLMLWQGLRSNPHPSTVLPRANR